MRCTWNEDGVLLECDGRIREASEAGHDAVLCDGRLAADKNAMAGVLRRGDAWTEALDNVEQFCDTGNQLFKIPAVLKFWEAAATLQDAGNRFWLLVVAQGVEDWVQR